MKFCGDAGHGGLDSGAVSKSGIKESVLALARTQEIARILRGMRQQVWLTRSDDRTLKPESRLARANGVKCDVGFSIHYNDSDSGAGSGLEIWTSKGDTLADPVASCICASIASRLPDYPLRTDYLDGDPDKERAANQKDLYMLRGTKAPWVLIECGFMCNPGDLAMAQDPAFNRRLCEAIALGLLAGVKSTDGHGRTGTNTDGQGRTNA